MLKKLAAIFVVGVMIGLPSLVSAEKTTIVVSDVLTSEKAFKEYIDDLNAQYNSTQEDVVVKDEPIPYNQVREQAILKHKSGKVPSATFLMAQWIPELVAAGVLAPLDQYVSDEFMSQFPDQYVEDVKVDGKIYAIPVIQGPIGLFANKDLLREAGYDTPRCPETMDEFREMVEKVAELGKDEDGNKIYGFAGRTSQEKLSAWWFVPWVWNYGGELVDENGDPTLNNEGFRDALEFYQWMGTNDYAPIGHNSHDSRSLFAQGQAAFVHDGPWMKGILRSITGSNDVDDMYMTCMMPEGATGEPTGHANQVCYGVFAKADSKEEIVDYLKFKATDPAANRNMYDKKGMMPASETILADPYYQNEYLKPFIENAPYMRSIGWRSPHWTSMQDVIAVAMQEAMLGKPIDDIVKKAQSDIEDIIE
jgi:multiple sugar transport system substrate-binding protein